jgi:hypothetical protein
MILSKKKLAGFVINNAMSYDLALYFRSSEFPDKEWSGILSWFDAREKTIEPAELAHFPYVQKKWFVPYGVFCTLGEHHPRLLFEDKEAHWEVAISTGSGFDLRQFLGYTLCYGALSLIPGTSVWDRGQYFDTLYQQPDKFLRKVNGLIRSHYLEDRYLAARYKRRLEMQQMGVLDKNLELVADPHILKLAAQNDVKPS